MENKNNFDFTEINQILETPQSSVNNALEIKQRAKKNLKNGIGSFSDVLQATKNANNAINDKAREDIKKRQENDLLIGRKNDGMITTESDLRMDYMNPAQKDNLVNHTIETDTTKNYKQNLGTASKTLQTAGSLSFLYTGSAGDLMKEIVETGNTPEILKGNPKAESIVAKIKFAIKQYTKGKNVEQEKKNLLVLKTQIREILNNKKI